MVLFPLFPTSMKCNFLNEVLHLALILFTFLSYILIQFPCFHSQAQFYEAVYMCIFLCSPIAQVSILYWIGMDFWILAVSCSLCQLLQQYIHFFSVCSYSNFCFRIAVISGVIFDIKTSYFHWNLGMKFFPLHLYLLLHIQSISSIYCFLLL